MSDAKHTPGPWRIVGVPYYEYWITNEPEDPRGRIKRIAIVRSEGDPANPDFPSDVRTANAELIASAPHMKDEIERLRETVRVLREECSRHERSLNDALAEVGRLAEAEALLREAKTILSEAKREVLIWLSDDCAMVSLINLCIGRIDAWLERRGEK